MLTGKTAIVTGGSRGIGAAVVRKFAESGANVVACSRYIQAEEADDISALKGEIICRACDVTDPVQVENLVRETIDLFGRVDILANIAGISPKAAEGMKIPVHELSIQQWRDVMETNLDSMFYCSKAVIPFMMEQNYGRIINMSSIVGLTNSEHGPASAAYVTSKTGVIGLTHAMAYDLAPYGITVNAVAAGRIITEMSRGNNPAYDVLHKDLIPMHRFGTPDEVAEVFLFYASERSSYITGDTTNITGGWFI